MSSTEFSRWSELPCRALYSHLTSRVDNPSVMEKFMNLPMWDRVCSVLGHYKRNRGRLPEPLSAVYEIGPAVSWQDLANALNLRIPELSEVERSYPREDAAVVAVDGIDLQLKDWTEAWATNDLDRLHSSFYRIDRTLALLSPCRRSYRSHDENHLYLNPTHKRNAFELLSRVHYRLLDVVSDYEKNRPSWTWSVTQDVRDLGLKAKYILQDILWTDFQGPLMQHMIRAKPNTQSSQDESTPRLSSHKSDAENSSSPEHTSVAPPPPTPAFEPSPEQDKSIGLEKFDAQHTSSTPQESRTAGFTPINKTRSTQRDSIQDSIEDSSSSGSSNSLTSTMITRLRSTKRSRSPDPSITPDSSPAKRSKHSSQDEADLSSPASQRKRNHEKAKGEMINSEDHEATNPCAKCSKSGKICKVPKDPKKSATFKCGDCIKGRLGCSLTALNPGRDDYDEEYRRECAAKEEAREAGRAKREQRKRMTSLGNMKEEKPEDLQVEAPRKRKLGREEIDE